MPDIIMSWEKHRNISPQVMLDRLKTKYPERELYCVSLDWKRSKEFICKARGVKGDVIVGWRENNYGPR